MISSNESRQPRRGEVYSESAPGGRSALGGVSIISSLKDRATFRVTVTALCCRIPRKKAPQYIEAAAILALSSSLTFALLCHLGEEVIAELSVTPDDRSVVS